MTINDKTTPRIYIACLAAYNNGKLHGRWINANQEPREIWAEISSVLKTSPERGSEEWAMHDYEGFGEIHLSECPDIAHVSTIARLIQDHGEAFTLWYQSQDGHGFDTEGLEEKFSEQWQGAHDSESSFADHLLEETGHLNELPEWARNYFDFESYARDLRFGGDYSFVRHAGQVYVFSNY